MDETIVLFRQVFSLDPSEFVLRAHRGGVETNKKSPTNNSSQTKD